MATVYLIPSQLDDQGLGVIPAYITSAIRACNVFFVENERTTRRYFKQLWKLVHPGEDIVIDSYTWHVIGEDTQSAFRKYIKEGLTIGIISEAGCPGVADPGQALVAIAQDMHAKVKPLVGPASILLALMASGMNGQQFHFHGYLPIDNQQRIKAIRELESLSAKQDCTQVFIETPYRNNQLIDAIIKNCNGNTRLCIATNITGPEEWIRTKTVNEWKKDIPDIHKRPAIFLLYSC
jgi:16S rRNA (cytidine1402-2'-O)-methyltransferase